MGIDFSHCDARWAYSGFKKFRNRIANQIGFPEYEEISTTDDPRYEKIKDDPILYLLAHSDCDGELTSEECKTLSPRLREIIDGWPDEDYDKRNALELCEGMDFASAGGVSLQFK